MLFGEASSASQLAEAARELIERTERTHREFEIILALLRADRLLAQRQAQDKGLVNVRARLKTAVDTVGAAAAIDYNWRSRNATNSHYLELPLQGCSSTASA